MHDEAFDAHSFLKMGADEFRLFGHFFRHRCKKALLATAASDTRAESVMSR